MIGLVGNDEHFSAFWTTKRKSFQRRGQQRGRIATLPNSKTIFWASLPWKGTAFLSSGRILLLTPNAFQKKCWKELSSHFFKSAFRDSTGTNFKIWIALSIFRHFGKTCNHWIKWPGGANLCKKLKNIAKNCPFNMQGDNHYEMGTISIKKSKIEVRSS